MDIVLPDDVVCSRRGFKVDSIGTWSEDVVSSSNVCIDGCVGGASFSVTTSVRHAKREWIGTPAAGLPSDVVENLCGDAQVTLLQPAVKAKLCDWRLFVRLPSRSSLQRRFAFCASRCEDLG